ncbi:MAG: RDD family protein [Rickettsiaceae bacterium]|nr:MAG: RDD family protein [Rickettsiaceae bacterium]
MKKQIIYSKFIPRLFSATLDSLVLAVLLPPITNFISTAIYRYKFQDYIDFANANREANNLISIFYTQNFYDYLINTNQMSTHFACSMIVAIITFLLIGIYFISFWQYFSATPGKIILRMKIADLNTSNKPSLRQLVKRYFSYLTVPIGIWLILFTEKGQALHDKIAATVVIKA